MIGDAVNVIETEAGRMSELARSGDLAAPIDHLGRWKARDVVAHLGGVHRWATRIVTERSMKGPGFTKSKLDGDELCEWFDVGAAALVQLLRSLDPDAPCPNFNPGSENTVGWWIRRQLHETCIHRWDVESASDQCTKIDAKQAVDGIDEFLDTFVRTRGKHTLDASLVLETTRPKQAWTLTPAAKPGRIDVRSGGSGDAAVIAGKPEPLLLALWGRKTIGDAGLSITGTADWSTLLKT